MYYKGGQIIFLSRNIESTNEKIAEKTVKAKAAGSDN